MSVFKQKSQESSGPGGSDTDLSVGTRTNTDMVVASSSGDDVTLPAATNNKAGLKTGTDKQQLDASPAKWAVGTYSSGDQVVHDRKVYECIVDRTNAETDDPATDTTGWRVLSGGTGSGSDATYTAGTGLSLSAGNEFSVDEPYSAAEKAKLAAIEASATADQTGGEIATALTGLSGTSRLGYGALKDTPVIPAGSVVVGSIPQAITGTASGSAMAADDEEDITVSSVGAPASYFTAGTSGDAGKIVMKRAGTYVLYGDIAVDNAGGDRTGPSFVVEGTDVEEIFHSNAYLRNASTAITVSRSVVFTVEAANTAIALKVINRDIANGSTSFDTVALSFTAVSNLRIIPVGGTEGAQGIPGVAGSGSVPVWAAGVHDIGDQVSYDDKIYVCLTARTAGDTSNPSADATGWAPLGRALTDVELGKLADGPAKWAAAVHAMGDMAVWDGKVYECIVARTGSDTDDPATDTTGWRVLSGGTGSGSGISSVATDDTLTGSGASSADPLKVANPFTDADESHIDAVPALWAAGTHTAGDQVVHAQKVYECIVDRTGSNTDNPATDTTGWRVLSGGTGGGGSFTPSKSNIYAAVKDVLHPTTNAGVSADDTNNELDIAGDDVTASRIANALESIGLATLGVLTRSNTIAGAGNENRINMTSSAIAMRFSATTYAVAAEAIDVGTILRFTATGDKLVIARVTSIVAELESSQIVSVGVTYLTGSHTTFSTAAGGDSVTTEAYALDASELAKRVIQNPYTGTDDEKAAFRTAIGAGTGGGSGPILYDKLVVYVNTNQLRQITGAGGPISFDGTEFWDPVGFGWIGDYSVNQHIRIYIEDGLAIPTGDFGLYTQTDGKVLDLTQANKQADESSVNANLGEWAVDKNIVPLDSVLAGLSLRQQSIVSQIAFNTLQTVVTPAQLAAMRSQSLSFDGGTTTWVPDDIFFEPQGTSANWHIWIVLPKNVYIPDSGDVTITYTGGPLTLTRANQQRVRTNVDALGEWSTYGFTSQEFFQRRALQRDYTVALRFWRDNSATPAAIPSDAGTLNVDPEAGLYAVNFPAGATNRRAHFALPQQYEIGYVAIDNRNRLSDFNNRIVSGQRVYDVASALSNTLEAFQMLIEVTVAE